MSSGVLKDDIRVKSEDRGEGNVLDTLGKSHEVGPSSLSFPISSIFVKEAALHLGFSHCGLAPAEPVNEQFMVHYEDWLRGGFQGGMHYLEHHLALRRDPRLLLPGAKTVISLAMSYNPGMHPVQKGIAWYAQGRDYHEVIKERLRELVNEMVNSIHELRFTIPEKTIPEFNYKLCVDTAPVMEKYWAWRCGIGWIGRHTQLVIPHEGSAFFLAEILITMEADSYDTPLTPSPLHAGCKACRRCLEACPTHAISERGMDARRCLSYLTIEHRGTLPQTLAPYLRECFYGCDRCLRACPHLSLAQPTPIDDFRPSPRLLAMQTEDWARLSPEDYRTLFRGSAVKRAKYEGLTRNIAARGENLTKKT